MKKILLIALTVSLLLISFAVPASAWSWKDDAKFEVAEYWVYVAEEGEIIVDGELDEGYLQGTKIKSYEDEIPYKRGGYDAVWDDADGTFFAYIAVDVTGMYIYAEIKDSTIFETTNTNGNDGDCFQIYLDWCTPEVSHPSAENLYEMYLLAGMGWDYRTYKSTYGVAGLQYIGWLSCDYNGVIASSMGFNPHTALGPDATDAVLLETKLVDDGWACEWFIPWRDESQLYDYQGYGYWKSEGCVAYYVPGSLIGIGFQACDDSDIDNFVTPDREENVGLRFDQRKELGLSYWADYSMLADVRWEGRGDDNTHSHEPDPGNPNTSDSAISIICALAVAGAGVVIFSKKKKD